MKSSAIHTRHTRTVLLTATFLLALLSTTLLPIFSNLPTALAGSDTYPAPWAPPTTQDSLVDTWGEFNRECTSYASWMLHSVNGFEMPFHADAYLWGSKATSLGYTVDMHPKVGSIFWSSSIDHVGWVESVSAGGSTISYEDYNYGLDGFWSEHTGVATSSASGYIHFKDIASGTMTPGIVRDNGGQWQWHLRNSNTGGTPDITPFGYGVSSTDTPLPGDWDGNGTTTPGIVRNVSNQWQFNLRNSNSGGGADVPVFTYGVASSDTPIVGDWDGNGTVTPGVVRNVGGQWHWYLRNSNTGGASSIDFGYGVAATDIPIVGDWDGNGTMTPGIVRIVGGQWQFNLRNSNTGGAADVPVFTYGNASTDTVIVGDWDGSGTMTPGIVRDNGGQWQWNLRNSNTGGAANLIFGYGVTATDTAIVGDWDGQ